MRLWATGHAGAGRVGQPGWRKVPVVGRRWVKTRRRVQARQGLLCEDFDERHHGFKLTEAARSLRLKSAAKARPTGAIPARNGFRSGDTWPECLAQEISALGARTLRDQRELKNGKSCFVVEARAADRSQDRSQPIQSIQAAWYAAKPARGDREGRPPGGDDALPCDRFGVGQERPEGRAA